MPDETCGEVLGDASALTLGDEPLAGAVEHRAAELWMTPAQDWSSSLTLPDQRTIARQLKDMGYVKHTIGSNHQGPKIGGKERCIYYRPERVSPPDFMPLLKRRVTGGPF